MKPPHRRSTEDDSASQTSEQDAPVTPAEYEALKEQVRNAFRLQFRRKTSGDTEQQPSGIPLVGPFRGRPINEVLHTNAEVFEIVAEEMRKALEEALMSEAEDGLRKAEYTHTTNVQWDRLETQGPDDLFEPGADAAEDVDESKK
jgi:hypothetical protein